MADVPFVAEMRVRDYECGLQGIVNNAVYQNYLEHARHEFLNSRGLDFAELTALGVIIVVIRAELDYKLPLKPRDDFSVSVVARQLGRLMLEARIVAVSLRGGTRPYFPPELSKLF